MPYLWVIGDSWEDPAYGPERWETGWPGLVSHRLRLGLVNSAVAGCGYIAGGASAYPIQAARGAGAGAALAVVFGTVNDQDQPPAAVARAAAATYRIIRDSCPGAPLIVFGPQYLADPPPVRLYAVRDAVRSAAVAAGALFVDPLLWMQGRYDLIDGTAHPTDDGQALLADLIAPILQSVLRPPPRAPWVPPGVEAGWMMPWHPDDDPAVPLEAT